MNTDDDDARLHRYIERLEELEPDAGPTLGPDGLREVARDMGVDEALIERAEAHADRMLARGSALIGAGRCTDAIGSLRVAVDLRPYDSGPVRELGRAYMHRHAINGASGDKNAAQHWFERALALKSDDLEAWNLLSQLTSKRDAVQAPARTSTARGRLMLAALAVCLGGGLVVGFMVSSDTVDKPAKPRQTTTVVATPPRTRATPPIPPHKITTQTPRSADAEIPMTLVADPRIAGATLVNIRSMLNVHSTSAWYKASFELLWRGEVELHKLELQAEGVDADGKVMFAEILKPVRERGPAVRPNDRIALHILARTSSDLKSVRIKPLVIFTQPAAKAYPAGAEVTAEWLATKPAGVQLQMHVRNDRSRTHLDKQWFHDLTLQVRNVGERALRHAKFQIRYVDSDGNVIDTVDRYVLITSHAPLLPDTARTLHVAHIVRSQPSGWKLAVVTAR